MTDNDTADETETDDQAPDSSLLSRRAVIAGVTGASTLAGVGLGYLLARDEPPPPDVPDDDPSIVVVADVPAHVMVGMRADAPKPIVIPGETIGLEAIYSGFHEDMFDGGAEGITEEFDVTLSIQPEFATEFEPVATGTLGLDDIPTGMVADSLDSDTFDTSELDFADHSAVSNDYGEFAPEADEPAETDVDLEVTVTSESYDVTASRTRTMTVTRLVDMTVDVDALRASFDVGVDGGEIDAMTIAGADVPVDLNYDGFGADVANREDEFTVSVLVRPGFDDDLEEVASRTLDAGETPADTVGGPISTDPISLARHSAISSTFASFEPDDEVQTTDLEVEVRVESSTYGVTVAEHVDFSVTVAEDDVTVTTVGRTRRPPTPDPDPDPDREIAVGGRLVLEGDAENEPYDQP